MALITIRKAHVKRIFPTDDDGNPQTDSDVWVDVLRIDEYSRAERPGEQGANYHLRWQDGPDYDMQEGFNTTRKTEKIKVVNPQDDSQFVEVLAIKKKSTTDPEGQHQVSRHTYDNSRDNKVREVYPRRIGHIEVPDSLDMTAETPSWADYLDAIGDGDRDLDQYVDFDIPHTFRHMDSLDKPDRHQIARIVFNTKDFAKAFADIPEDADPDHPPVRLDPFQYIVNVSWEGGVVMTASSRFADPASRLGFTSKDGDTWELFGPQATGFDGFFGYAHGNGVMLMDSSAGTWRSTDGGQNWTNMGEIEPGGFCFGKVKDPDNPTGPKIGRFVGISRGGDLFYSEDGLAWTGAGFETFLGGEFCQFVNGVFFAFSGGYLSWPDVDQSDLWTRVASSTDGISWSEALLWHPDSFSYGDGGPDQTVWPTGTYQTAGVAWDGNRFVVVGNMPIVKKIGDRNDYTYVETAFSASSPDGFSWSGQDLIFTDDFQSADQYTGYASFAFDIAFGKLSPSDVPMWVVVGQFAAGPPGGGRAYNYAWSTSGAGWNISTTIPADASNGPSITLSGVLFTNKKFIACGAFWDYSNPEVGMIWTSESGTSWTRGNTGFDETVAQFNALYKK